MNLKQSIRKILKEETVYQKFEPIIDEMIYNTFDDNIICDYVLETHAIPPKNIKSLYLTLNFKENILKQNKSLIFKKFDLINDIKTFLPIFEEVFIRYESNGCDEK